MNLHEIHLEGYNVESVDSLDFGTAGSYGNEFLSVTLGKGWQGLTTSAIFLPCGVKVNVSEGHVVEVPWEATSQELPYTKSKILFQGVSDGRCLNTYTVRYSVSGPNISSVDPQPPTPSQYEQFVQEVKEDANKAANAAAESARSAAEAAQSATSAAQSGQQAVTDIGNAKDSALEAIDAAREEAASSISADVEGAKQAAADAEQSAKNAAAALEKVQAAGQDALDDIATERQNTLSDIQNEGTKQQSAVAGIGTAALEAIGQTEQAVINQIKQTGETQVGEVQSAGTTQISQVNSTGAAQVQAVKDEGVAQTVALNDTAEAHKNELESIASHSPQPNTATGKWQVWNAETGQYEDTDAPYQSGYYTPSVAVDGTLTWTGSQAGMPTLPSANIKGPKGDKGDPGLGVPSPTQSDAGKVPTVKADGSAYELAGPYAPLSAAIRPTASGNPVNITDSVEWPLLGLKVYGKSTQVTTTGAQLFDASTALDNTWIIVGSGETEAANGYWTSDYIPVQPGQYISPFKGSGRNAVYDAEKQFVRYINHSGNIAFTISEGETYIRITGSNKVAPPESFMFNAGSTKKPWEPYTGGKPSPSPEYPQPIVSAGDGGRIDITVSDGASLSQSMTIATPNGLPGIPVDFGGNYTDESGQQWACDYKDYKNEAYIKKLTLIPDLSIGTFTKHVYGMFICDLTSYSAPIANSKVLASMCTHFPSVSSQNLFGIVVSNRYVIIGTALAETFGSVDDFNNLLLEQRENNTPVQLLYYQNETTETPLSEEEIAAYKALHTYDGATVASTAEDVAGLDVRYVADAQKYIDNRLTAALSTMNKTYASYEDLSGAIREGINTTK